jgi:hypothetical protein
MIPKVVHYCWFGKGEMPRLAVKCIKSWEKYLPDYQLKLWNEENFDLTINSYLSEAYKARKYAFVTDYVRLYVLYNEGGIYMDIDVEVIKSFDSFLTLPGFTGFEDDKYVPTGIMACEKGNLWAKEQLNYYTDRHFLLSDGTFDMTTNTRIISGIMGSNGFKLQNSYQVYQNCMHVFPNDYFCPLKFGKVILTDNTHCIHHFASTWNPGSRKLKKLFLKKILGGSLTYNLVKLKRKILKQPF